MAVKNGEFLIVNRRTGKALQANGAENGFAVVQAEISGEAGQLWTAAETKEGVKLQNKLAKKLLDVITGGSESGLTAQVWEDVGGESQLWRFSGRKYKKLMHAASGKVLDISGMREEDGAPAQIWEDIGGENQQWELRDVGGEAPATKTVKKAAGKPAAKRKPGKVKIEAKTGAKGKQPTAKKKTKPNVVGSANAEKEEKG